MGNCLLFICIVAINLYGSIVAAKLNRPIAKITELQFLPKPYFSIEQSVQSNKSTKTASSKKKTTPKSGQVATSKKDAKTPRADKHVSKSPVGKNKEKENRKTPAKEGKNDKSKLGKSSDESTSESKSTSTSEQEQVMTTPATPTNPKQTSALSTETSAKKIVNGKICIYKYK